ncbi:MAG: BglII/BstYI family type II restriction endonuclease [Methanosarcinales archaeon]
MKKVFEYSHLGGLEILKVRYPHIEREIDEIIESIKITGKTKISKEKTKMGKLLYSPRDMNKAFKEEFYKLGYKELKDFYDIDAYDRKHKIKAFKQIDFLKERVLVEVQFGKYAFMFYDLAKFQYFYNKNQADVGIEIVPCYYLHKKMSTGVSYGEQLVYDIERLQRNFPSVPIKVIFIDV